MTTSLPENATESPSVVKQQGVFFWSPRGWAPERGIHRGIACDECGDVAAVVYRGRSKVLCAPCAKAAGA